jgi:hypothetical protein
MVVAVMLLDFLELGLARILEAVRVQDNFGSCNDDGKPSQK